MSDDEIKWESAYSDDSLDKALDAVGDAASGSDESPEGSAIEPTQPVEPAADAQPAGGGEPAPGRSVFAPEPAPSAPQPAAPAPSAPAAQPSEAPPVPPVTSPAVTPPGETDERGGAVPIRKIVGALAVVVPIAVAAFLLLRDGGDPLEAVCEQAGALADECDNLVVDDATDDEEAEALTENESLDEEPTDEGEPPDEEVDEPSKPEPPADDAAFVYPDLINDVAADGALGSGCTPGSNEIPDGVWFAAIRSWSSESASFDLICAYTSANATTAAQERGDNVALPIYATNDNPRLRLADYGADAQLTLVPTVALQAGLDETYGVADLDPVLGAIDLALGQPMLMWIYVNDGVITELVVQDAGTVQIASVIPAAFNCGTGDTPGGQALMVSGIPSDDPDGGLNIRDAPGDGEVLFVAPNGLQFEFVGGCELRGTRPWYQVTNSDRMVGTGGWATSRFLVDVP